MAKTLSELWTDTVQADPQALALADASDGRRWTRAELAAAAGECRAQLPAGGEFRGRYVVLAETNGIRWLSRFLGLLAAGAIPALVDPGEPPDAQAAVGRRIGAVGVWSGESALRILPGARPRRRDYCLAKITSGTTGLPKALPFTHAQMVADGRQICASMAIGPQDVNLAAIPFGHSYGLGNLVIPLLVQGTALVCSPGPFPQAIAATCAAWRPSVFPAVPAILRALAQADVAASDLASLRLVISAGSFLAPADARAFLARFGRAVRSFYGSSETGGICFDRTGEATLTGTGVGTPLEGVRLLARRDRRFTVASPAVMRRGVHRPADRGVISAGGQLHLVGRVGRALKVGGKRLDPAEVEAALKALPGVSDAMVLADPGPGEKLAGIVVSTENPRAIRGALAARLAPWKIPGRIVPVAEIPVTPRGKPDYARIAALLRRDLHTAGPGTPAGGPTANTGEKRGRLTVVLGEGPAGRFDAGLPALAGASEDCPVPAGHFLGSQGSFSLFDSAGWLLGAASQAVASNLEAATREIYRQMLAVSRDWSLVRIWNYVPNINAPDLQGLENYQGFCRARAQAFEERFGPGFPAEVPAGSAVGCDGETLTVVFAACRARPRHVENPLQVPAYEYPARYGPRPPAFARATVVTEGARRTVFISGTSAIRGHATVAPDCTPGQAECTLENLREIARACGLGADLGAHESAERQFKVYLRHADDQPTVATMLERGLLQPTDRVSYVRADICRKPLQIEIEAIIAGEVR
jgi:acyl-CoA synthetase (AMP-forming)/AMP-acid ligase II/enamine deaminase RidA (YjgF/YER057c/UK114 family)